MVMVAAVLGIFVLVFCVLISEEVLKEEQFKRTAKTTNSLSSPTGVVPIPTDTFQIKGIDVSHYQGNISWDSLTPTITFAICKATEGRSLMDTEFSHNWTQIKLSGRVRGAYHFYLTSDDPETQAQFFWKTVSTDYQSSDLPLILDIEQGSLRKKISPEALQADVLSFLTTLEKLSGNIPMVYCSTYFANEYLDNPKLSRYPLWLAEYTTRATPNIPKTWQQTGWRFWQKSDSYDLKQISGELDFDLFHGSKADLQAFTNSLAK